MGPRPSRWRSTSRRCERPHVLRVDVARPGRRELPPAARARDPRVPDRRPSHPGMLVEAPGPMDGRLGLESEGLGLESEGLRLEGEGLRLECHGRRLEGEGLRLEARRLRIVGRRPSPSRPRAWDRWGRCSARIPTRVDFWSKGFVHQSHGLGWLVDGLRLRVHAVGIAGRCPSTYWGKGFAFSAEAVALLAEGITLRAKGVTSASRARPLRGSRASHAGPSRAASSPWARVKKPRASLSG